MDEVLSRLQKLGALFEGHFAEADGNCSSLMVITPRLMQNPEEVAFFAEMISKKFTADQPELIIGSGEKSILLAYEVAKQKKAKFAYTLLQNGTMTIRKEFIIPQGVKTLIVSDIVMSGQTIRGTVELLRALHARIIGISAILDMSDGLARFRFPFYPLACASRGLVQRKNCDSCKAGVPITKVQ